VRARLRKLALMTLLLSDEDVRATLAPASPVNAMEEFYRVEAGDGIVEPPRVNLMHETVTSGPDEKFFVGRNPL
jgi:ornithine cyclodeaminase/alanine dehydrogenase-like protein (mu-crystallin family)